MKREALRRLAANAGQLLQLVNQSNHGLGKSGHYLTPYMIENRFHHRDTETQRRTISLVSIPLDTDRSFS
jgi:hypothetical protein